MGVTIDIDTGGTFTDGFFTFNDQICKVKVDTTPHDFTECFMNCIGEGAKRFQLPLGKLLKQTEIIRFSCTIGTNALIQRKGPRLGLIVSKGHENNLYNENGLLPALDFLVSKEMIRGIGSDSSDKEKEAAEINEDELRQMVRELLERGARVLVVSLLGSDRDGLPEKQVKQFVLNEYPRHYLGSIPVLSASEITAEPGEYFRTNAALLNAYLHQEMVKVLYKAEEDLRAFHYNKPLMIVHANGGVARVAKTKAIDTHNSGPVSGLMGSLYMSQLYNEKDVITFDIGGTSTDVGVIQEGSISISEEINISEIPLRLPVYGVHGVGAGGGSIAGVDMKTKQLKVGPESAGALPGPACYNLGGYSPTATDAEVVLGFIDPDYFLGGEKKLDKAKAAEAIQYDVAEILNVSVEEAALKIQHQLSERAALAINEELAGKGLSAHDFVLFAFGGAGGSFACEIAAILNISKIYTFQQNSVFSAFGSSISDVLHIYDEKTALPLLQDNQVNVNALPGLNEIINSLRKRADMDMRGEGFEQGEIGCSLELVITDSRGDYSTAIVADTLSFSDESDLLSLIEQFKGNASSEGAGAAGLSDIAIVSARFKATAAVPHYQPASNDLVNSDAQGALKGKRPVYWKDHFVETDIYDRSLLQAGHGVQGPAIIEAEDTTYTIPEGWRFVVDQYLNGIIEEVD